LRIIGICDIGFLEQRHAEFDVFHQNTGIVIVVGFFPGAEKNLNTRRTKKKFAGFNGLCAYLPGGFGLFNGHAARNLKISDADDQNAGCLKELAVGTVKIE